VPLSYTCHRCGQNGHYIKFCPTNGDPTFDPVNRLLNVPQANRKKFTNIEGVDTANKTIVQNSDGTYEIFEPSKLGREKIARERFDMTHETVSVRAVHSIADSFVCAASQWD